MAMMLQIQINVGHIRRDLAVKYLKPLAGYQDCRHQRESAII